MTTTSTISPTLSNPWRQLRLARGWEPLDVVGRMKTTASREGLVLPPAWLLLHWVFQWENQRVALPAFYQGLLDQVYTTARCRVGAR